MRAKHLIGLVAIAGVAGAQTTAPRGQPIIDMHLHAYLPEPGDAAWPFRRMCVNDAKPCSNQSSRYSDRSDYLLQGTLDMMRKHNVVLGFLSGDIGEVSRWSAATPGRFVRSAGVYDGLQVSVDSIRKAYAANQIQAIESAPFLSVGQRRDILYNNAARFLRLDSGVMR